jgi:hypothetical protein
MLEKSMFGDTMPFEEVLYRPISCWSFFKYNEHEAITHNICMRFLINNDK